MGNIISYCLFETKDINQRKHRGWDKYRMEQDRYWYNIPAVYIANTLLYPDFNINVFISENVKTHPLYPLLLKLSKADNFTLLSSNMNYLNTEPTMWRMIPFFKKETDILLCRDIDSLPTINEVKSTLQFIESDYLIHTMRTHRQHNSQSTHILAGLCGFKPKELRNKNIPHFSDFKTYYSYSGRGWGCDQNTLIDLFYNKVNDKKEIFLDSALTSTTHEVTKNNLTGYLDFQNYDFQNEVLDFLDNFTEWSGEPIDFRGDNLNKLLNYNFEICDFVKNIINSIPDLKKFYKI